MLIGSVVLLVTGAFSTTVHAPESADVDVARTARPDPIVAEAPPVSDAPPPTEMPTSPATAAPPATVVPVATTVPLTGSVQGCDELHRFTDDDGDAWGECVPDVDGAHARAQAIVSFLGLQELTCLTDPTTAASTCEALSSEGAVRTLVIEMTGDIRRNVETRPAPTTTAPPPPPTPPPAPVPFADTGGGNGCDPNYTGCVPIDSDVDCASGSGNGPSYTRGPVEVIGSDIYGLDRDGDGIGCE